MLKKIISLTNYKFSRKRCIYVSMLSYIDSKSTLQDNVAISRLCIVRNSNINQYSYVSPNTQVSNCDIGKFCSIGSEVMIGLGKHPVDMISTSPIFYTTNNRLKKRWVNKDEFIQFEKINIGNDVWIGNRAIILDGVKIGNGAIVAAGAIVTKDVPPYSIVGGCPAKVIKYRFENDEIIKLEHSKWWDFSELYLKNNTEIFRNKNIFIDEVGS